MDEVNTVGTPEVKPRQIPTMGRIVIYTHSDGKATSPALVKQVRVIEDADHPHNGDEICDLHVFNNHGEDFGIRGVLHKLDAPTNYPYWNWPERIGS